jgi:mannose-6-phosphate isomerase-like protein (cupin superfamily)
VGHQSINFGQKFGLFQEQWQPKVIAEMNDYQFKIVKLEGDFVWHHHNDTDETFIVIEGTLRIDFRDGAVDVSAGEMFVVPKGVEHKPYAEREVKLLLIEPRGVPNTGDEGASAPPSKMSGFDRCWPIEEQTTVRPASCSIRPRAVRIMDPS